MGEQFGDVTRKSIGNKGKAYANLSSCLIHWQGFLEIWSHASLRDRGRHTNTDFPYTYKRFLRKGYFYLGFTASPVSAVS